MLIVNADDFGLTNGVTEGIIKAHKYGVVTHTSIMANGLFFDEAVEIAKKEKTLCVGVHLVATWGKPLTIKKNSLVDKGNGCFYGYKRLIYRFLMARIRKEDIYNEWEAQIEKVIRSGLDVTHIDSHHHIHMLPIFNKVVYELARKYKIERVRVTRERIELGDPFFLVIKKIIFLSLSFLSRNKRDYLFYGLGLQASRDYKRDLNKIMGLKNEKTEVMVHPGIVDDMLKKIDVMTYARENELSALISAKNGLHR